jgi:cell wall-associated NlpC family hydrolase
LLTLSLAVSSVPAFGVPSSKREQAVAAKRQVDRLDARVEAAAEAYNEAADQLFGLRSEMSTLQKRIAKTGKRIDSLQGDLNARAWSMYRNGPVTFLEVLLQAESFDKFAATWDILKSLNKQDANAVIELNAARKEAKAARSELAKKERAAKRQVDIMADRKHSIEGQLAERKNILRGLEGEIAAMEAADAAAAARRASQASYTPVIEQFFPPPSRAARGEIVSVAMRYLGAPYRWGADGPNSFDCSGFTMFVYRQVGVSLPHNSGAQFGSGERVSRSDLQPGDLVFFGSPIHHVGIYVGGGSYIHSPRTGDVVRVATLDRGDYVGAVRP